MCWTGPDPTTPPHSAIEPGEERDRVNATVPRHSGWEVGRAEGGDDKVLIWGFQLTFSGFASSMTWVMAAAGGGR